MTQNTTVTMHSTTVPVLMQMLGNAKVWLDKAEAHATAKKFETTVLVEGRLAPDMLPFRKQIQIATDNAKGMVARLSETEMPKWEDNETTFEQLQARLDKTIAFVKAASPEKFVGAETRPVVVKWAGGERAFANGMAYAFHYAMPNFMFHLTTAYAILRSNGVDIGKTDYLAGAEMAAKPKA
jgi:uncharacterized protein